MISGLYLMIILKVDLIVKTFLLFFVKIIGHNPGDLGEDIRSMTLPTGATRNTTGGTGPQKAGSCN
ncbi:hypothetical protein DVR12_26415 [Chitinophaga silvatica]|uniref:Uncharacterized protein n=1 Tax=Chitinophaga silvatica TaxID=2282649 RepID=A0A3E1Y2R1_9BACT|nr:hypothetical protein DVR12_26415 [Chitinophaga silvatica]